MQHLSDCNKTISINDLHRLDRFPINLQQWDQIVNLTMKPIPIKRYNTIFDAGCGSGAYLHSLLRQNKKLQLQTNGVDFCDKLVDISRQVLPKDSILLKRDIRDYSDIPSNSFDISISFGVFIYLESEKDIKIAFNELVRVTKPGGYIMIGRMNSKEKFVNSLINFNTYVKYQCKVDSLTFWNNINKDVQLIDVKQLSEIYNLEEMNDNIIGPYRHCAYFQKNK
ncbi:MAG: class I SAM-dependent methyltransferase [Promethearchaeota archaeon]